MSNKVLLWRDIEQLKMWGNEAGVRFHRDPADKTRYRVYFTDEDVDKLETFVRNQQDQIKALNNARETVYQNGFNDGVMATKKDKEVNNESTQAFEIDGDLLLQALPDKELLLLILYKAEDTNKMVAELKEARAYNSIELFE